MDSHSLRIGVKVFLRGMLLQFFVQTFATFILGLDQGWMQVVRMRKEILIVLFGLGLLRVLRKKHKRSLLRNDTTIKWLEIAVGVSIVLSLVISLVLHDQPLFHRLLAFKYDFFGYIIFLLFVHIARLQSPQWKKTLLTWYSNIIKGCLIIAVFRRLIILVKPGTLEYFGYSRGAVEGDIGIRPPAAYKTDFHQGYTRNQFLFERPISYGFRLVAFRPLFFVLVLKRTSRKKVRGRRVLYMLNIFLTFSRAAWGSWIIITFILFFLTYKKHWKVFVILAFGGLAGLVGLAWRKSEIFLEREHSNTGHIEMMKLGWQKFISSPRIGQGAATAGPGSHQLGDESLEFNPENQYLQLLDEFGIRGLLRIGIFFRMMLQSIPSIRFLRSHQNPKQRKRKKEEYFAHRLRIAMGCGMAGLGISGLVLHSFADRMIVYPTMVVFALAYTVKFDIQKKEKQYISSCKKVKKL